MIEKIGYLKEIEVEGRLGRIYPIDEVRARGDKAEAKSEKHHGEKSGGRGARQ